MKIIIPAGFILRVLKIAVAGTPFEQTVMFGIAILGPPVVPKDELGINLFEKVEIVGITLMHFPNAERSDGRLGTVGARAVSPVAEIRDQSLRRLARKDGPNRVPGDHRIIEGGKIRGEKAVPAEVGKAVGSVRPTTTH